MVMVVPAGTLTVSPLRPDGEVFVGVVPLVV